MVHIDESIKIEASVEQVWEFLGEPKNFLDVWPSMIEVSNVEVDPRGFHDYDWVYKMAGLKFKGHAHTVEGEKNKYAVVKNEAGIPSVFRWTYESLAPDLTMLRVEVDYTIPIPVLGKMAEPLIRKINEREAQTLLANIKSALEETVRPMPQPEMQPHV